MAKKYINYWDEDNYPVREGELEEYIEDWDDENDEYEHQYSPIQGNWDLRDFEDLDDFQPITRRSKSMKANFEAKIRNKQQQKIKYRKEAKEKEKQRQRYYHYSDEE